MIQGTNPYYPYENPEKLKAVTPSTAESLAISPMFTQIYDSSQGKVTDSYSSQGTIFKILQERFESKADEKEQSKMLKGNVKNMVEENLQQCQFKIVINIVQQKGNLVKSFSKKIIKTIESNNEITLIFDRQYQKLKIDTNTKYVMGILIETLDGFSKRIWEQKITLEENLKKWSVITIPSQKNDKFLNMEVEKIGKFYMKPLSLKLPSSALQEFFDYKLKLLNKSELLSSLKSISQLKGILQPLTKQNMGSRIIQKLLTKANSVEIEMVISELKPIFKQMILDRYGNYVFQKVFKMANKQQKKQCLNNLHPYLIQLLVSKEGTHCIQTLVDYLEVQQTEALFEGFSEEQIFYLSTNKFSMHFIQKVIPLLSSDKLAYTLINRFNELAIDRQGIVVLKALMGWSADKQAIRYSILFSCQQCFYHISYTEYGHYIVQEMFNHYHYCQLFYFLGYIIASTPDLSQNQYSSSIVRKAIEIFGDYVSIPMINRILEGGLSQLMQCSSGEFVLHRLMELTLDEKAKQLLMNQMMVQSQAVKCYQKRQKWMKYFKLI